MKQCKLVILDEVNIKFENLDIATKRKLKNTLTYFIPHSIHTEAYKLGRWNGTVSYCDIAGRTYLNLAHKILPIIYNSGYEVILDDRRCSFDIGFDLVAEESYSSKVWPDDHTHAGQPIILRDYQVDYINTFLKDFQGVGVASTGSGKSLCIAVLSDKIEEYGRSIVIVPRKDLVLQLEQDYKNIGLDVGVFYGARKDFDKTHTLCTWQSLEAFNKKSKKFDSSISVDMFVSGVAGIIIDETHSAKSAVLRKLLSTMFSSVPIRWGLTGTVPKEDYDIDAIVSVIGPVLGNITAKELQDRGVLANLAIEVHQLVDNFPKSKKYQDEFRFLTTDKNRISYIANFINDITIRDNNTLVLVDRVQCGKMLQEMILNSVFISGTTSSEDRKKYYDKFKQENNLTVIATYGVASTGIDIARVFNVILVEPGKSFVRVIQSIGRGIRKSKDKDFVNIYDICSDSYFSKKHLCERKKYYTDAGYPYSVTKINY